MNTPTGEEPGQPVPKRRFSERAIGVFMVVGSGVIAYLCIILPLLAASRHEDDVSISMKGVACVPALLTIGLILILTGDKPNQVLGSRQKPTVMAWIICIVMAGVGILLYEWLKSRLRDYGYGF